MIEATDYDPPLGPFELLSEQWYETDKSDPEIEARLRATVRDAWSSGDTHERKSVLSFVFDRRDEASADLILDGLKTNDRKLAMRAAVLATVLHGRSAFDFGPDLRSTFRRLVRRFPEIDTLRPGEFYGHEPGDDDDSAERPFVNLYEDWRADPYPRNPAILRKLVDSYRQAWAEGDAVDRAFVLEFISTNSNPIDPALAVDGIGSGHRRHAKR